MSDRAGAKLLDPRHDAICKPRFVFPASRDSSSDCVILFVYDIAVRRFCFQVEKASVFYPQSAAIKSSSLFPLHYLLSAQECRSRYVGPMDEGPKIIDSCYNLSVAIMTGANEVMYLFSIPSCTYIHLLCRFSLASSWSRPCVCSPSGKV